MAKCAELVRHQVMVAIIDVVTTRHFNLFAELLELLDREDPVVNAAPPDLYASACRNVGRNGDALVRPHAHIDGVAGGRPQRGMRPRL